MKIFKKGLILLAALMFFFTGCASALKKETNQGNNKIRVVTTYKPATDIVLALGGKDKLVGVSDGGKKDPVMVKLDESWASKLAEVGSKKNGVNMEQIVALKPDVVILYPTKESDDTVKKISRA